MPSCTLAPLLMPQAPRSTSADRRGRVAQRRRTCTARRQSRQASPQRCPRCRPSHTGGQLRRHQLRPHSRFGRCVIATVTEAPVGEMRGLPPSRGRALRLLQGWACEGERARKRGQCTGGKERESACRRPGACVHAWGFSRVLFRPRPPCAPPPSHQQPRAATRAREAATPVVLFKN